VSPRSWKQRISDMIASARNILDFTGGMTRDSFLGNPQTIRAVAFEFTILGEAARAMPAEIQERFPDVPWGKMQGIRNILIHEYFRLDEEILWNAVQQDIPQLLTLLEEILSSKDL
jgi:uncharacterized protein with HEPN domain